MSYEAIRWAMSQPVPKSSAKFVLVAMADCVNADGGDMLCWPSVQHLADMTGQDRKTVIDGMRRLRADGYIADTKERKGATGQVVVYALKSPEAGTVTAPSTPASTPSQVSVNSTESGTDTETGTVPLLDGNSTAFPHQQSRFSLSTVPKTGHGTKKEPVKNQEGTSKRRSGGFDAARMEVPDWLDSEVWGMWCRDRTARGRRISEDAARLQVKKLEKYRADGFAPSEVIEHCIANGYAGLFPPQRSAKPPTGKHAGFGDKNYREGVEPDGSFQ